jgi:hypothetical protein
VRTERALETPRVVGLVEEVVAAHRVIAQLGLAPLPEQLVVAVIDVTSARRGVQGMRDVPAARQRTGSRGSFPRMGRGSWKDRASRVARSLRPRASTGSSRDRGRLPQ